MYKQCANFSPRTTYIYDIVTWPVFCKWRSWIWMVDFLSVLILVGCSFFAMQLCLWNMWGMGSNPMFAFPNQVFVSQLIMSNMHLACRIPVNLVSVLMRYGDVLLLTSYDNYPVNPVNGGIQDINDQILSMHFTHRKLKNCIAIMICFKIQLW